ncbi:MAG: hypothetical protein P4L87_16175, partial [Formivibrio sp.]|nr:hypothetical protein [Formivibrio sp.]
APASRAVATAAPAIICSMRVGLEYIGTIPPEKRFWDMTSCEFSRKSKAKDSVLSVCVCPHQARKPYWTFRPYGFSSG